MDELPKTGNGTKRVTMRTLAEMLGVTKTTISLALRDHASISEKTKKRVKDLARELNYRPDPAISAIATQRWSGTSPDCHRVMAYLCHHNQNRVLHYSDYFPPAKERAHELGYRLEPFYLDEYPNAQAVTRVLYSRGIRGIIVPPIHNPQSERAMNIDWSKFTAVCCGIGRVRPPLHTVTPDTFANTSLVWEILAKAGYTRIGSAIHCHHPYAYDDWQRIGATCAAMRFRSLEQSSAIPLHTDDIYDKEALIRWYEKYKPEVVLGFNWSVGSNLESFGVRVPEDVEFVCLMALNDRKWSGVIHQFDQIARISVELLDNELRHNQWGLPANPNTTLVQPSWNAGSTLRAVPELVGERLLSVRRSAPEPVLA